MSAFDSSKTTTTSGSTTTNPWAPQAGALTDAFGKAQNAYNTASGAVAPTDFTAQMTPDQLNTFHSMVAQGGNQAVPQSSAAAGNTLSSAGANGASGALTGLAGYNANNTNNPDALVAAANKYADGQNIDAQVNNAMLNATQQARDVTMPGIEQAAAAGGNTNSSRAGIADGLVQRGLAEQGANLGASLRSTAFQNGLTLAQAQAAGNNTSNLGALNSAGAIGDAAANAGTNANNSSVNQAAGLNSTAMQGGAGEQAAQQAALTNQQQQFASKTQSPYANLQQLMAIIGGQNWGSSSTNNGTSTATSSPSLISDIGSVGGFLTKLLPGS